MDLSGQVALVTGASRGIGREIASQLAGAGARVGVHYNQNRQAAESALSALSGGPHALFQADLSDADATRDLAASVLGEMGNIDILVNNAGVYDHHPPLEVDYSEWQCAWNRTLATNLLGPANLTFFMARHMAEHGGGRIVNVSSRGAFRGEPDAPAYGASKAGLNAFSQSMAQALAASNVFVYVVAPGFVETDMAADLLEGPGGEAIRRQSPLGRVARPDEIAGVVVFLASGQTEFLTGCIVDINGASYLRS